MSIRTETETGQIIHIDSTNNATEVSSAIVDIYPVQDLHGYSKPWVGGVGKNKCPTVVSGSNGTAIFTTQSDGTVKVSGTAGSNDLIYYSSASYVTLPAGSYKVSTGQSDNNYRIRIGKGTNGTTLVAQAAGSTDDSFTLTEETELRVGLRVQNLNGQTLNATYSPMIRVSTESATYEPYTNICPISGHTDVVVVRTNENLAGDDGHNMYTTSDGTATASTYNSTILKIKQGQTYVVKQSESNTATYAYFRNYPKVGDVSYNASRIVVTAESFTFNAPIDGYVLIRPTYNVSIVSINKGTTALATAEDTDVYTIALGTTVYGGTLDVTTGLLTVTCESITFDGSDDEGWNGTATDSGTGIQRFYTTKSYAPNNSIVACDSYVIGSSTSAITQYTDGIIIWDSGRVGVSPSWAQGMTLAQFKTGLASQPFQIVKELATPVEYYVEPQQIELLKGDNNVWASSGDITLTWNHVALLDEAVMLNGKYLELAIDGYMTLGTSGRRSIERKLDTYSVSTADGEKLKNSVFPSREIRVHYVIQTDTEEDLTDAVNQLNNILNQDEIDFIFHDEEDKFFSGSALLDSEPKKYRHAVKGTWTIYCAYPFKRSVEVTEYSSETDATISGNSATFAFDYNGTYPAKPKLRAEFASAKVGGDYNEDGDCGYVAFLDPDENIIQLGNPEVIDVDEYNKNSTLVNSEFTSLTGWTANGVSTAQIADQYWNNGSGQTQSYAAGTGTLSRTTTGAINFEFDIVHRLCVSQAAQVGTFECYAMNGNDIVVGFSIEKTGSGTAGKVNYILNNNVVGTDTIDLSLYNQHFGFCQRNPVYVTQTYQQKVVTYVKQKKKKKKKKVTTWVTKTRKVQKGWSYTQSNLNSGWSKDEGVVIFSIGNLADRTFKSSDIDNVISETVTIGFTGNLNTNAIHSCSMIGKVGVPFAEIPNVFTAGDIVEADCNSANVVLYRSGSAEGHLEPQYGALGNDWEDFEIKAGRNIIRAVWSEWVDEDYKPTIKLIFNEVYL